MNQCCLLEKEMMTQLEYLMAHQTFEDDVQGVRKVMSLLKINSDLDILTSFHSILFSTNKLGFHFFEL